MIYLFVNSVDRTADLTSGSLFISNEIQQRADGASFNIFRNSKPTENQEIEIYRGDEVASIAGATVTIKGYFTRNVGCFYAGQKLFIRINDADEEEVEILSYNESTLQITLVSAPSGSVIAGDKIGEIIFGGLVSRVTENNVRVAANLEYAIEAVDFSKIFDKALISDTWADVDSRYIINDFCNSTVNYNIVVDTMNYADNAAIQAEWIESGDGNNPTVDTTDYQEGTAAGVFGWTFAAGTTTWEATPTQTNVSEFTGANTGTPTKGLLGFWLECTDYTKITTASVYLGSDSGNNRRYDFTVSSNEWVYATINLSDPDGLTGTPDWTVFDYIKIVITETATSSIRFDGFRFLQNNFFRHYPNVIETPDFDDIRSPQISPTNFIQKLAKMWEYVWFIDYSRRIHFKPRETDMSPVNLSPTSNNYSNLQVGIDQSQFGNRIIIRGGEKTSDNYTRQGFPGDDAIRTWILKSKFAGLIIKVADGTDNHAAEAGTTTTNITVTGHGLSAGDFIVNTSRANAVREVLTIIGANDFTVEAIASQTSGDNIDFATVTKTSGIEGIIDETTVDYVYNSNEKSIKTTASEATLGFGKAIIFKYYARIPIQIQYQDGASISALRALGFGDGIFDLDPYTDRNIKDIGTALAIAQAKISEYSNAIIEGGFATQHHGIKAGQIVHIEDTVRGLDDDYVVQTVAARSIGARYEDVFSYNINFGSTLFGIIEFFQKLLALKDGIDLNVDDIVESYVTTNETVETSDVNSAATNGGFKSAKIAETVTSDDLNTALDFPSGTWRFEPNGVSQPLESRFNLCDFA